MARTFPWFPPRDPTTGRFLATRLGLTVGNNYTGQQMDFAAERNRIRAAGGDLSTWEAWITRKFYRWGVNPSEIADDLATFAALGVGMVVNLAANTAPAIAGGVSTPVQFTDIIDGEHDDWLEQVATVLAAHHQQHPNLPVIRCWFHEPFAHAQNNSPPGATKEQQAELYRAAQAHIESVVRPIDPDSANVYQSTEWQWQPSQGGGLLFYPGSDVCDLVAFTGANAYSPSNESSWKLLSERLAMAGPIKSTGLPIVVMAAGTGAYQGVQPKSKAAWIAEIPSVANADGNMMCVIYAHTRWADTGRDQRFHKGLADADDPAALAAMRAIAADPRMSNTLGAAPAAPSRRRPRRRVGAIGA